MSAQEIIGEVLMGVGILILFRETMRRIKRREAYPTGLKPLYQDKGIKPTRHWEDTKFKKGNIPWNKGKKVK